jgi:hypothetical protein
MSGRPTLRTLETEASYRAYRASLPADAPCPLCEKAPATTQFTYWKIAENTFPYDRIAGTHDMLLPLRHVMEGELTEDELPELAEIKDNSISEYNWILESTHTNKSIPSHFHLHLMKGKDTLNF